MAQTMEIDRSDLTQVRQRGVVLPVLAPGAVRLRIDSFAVTANNVTYAVLGDAFGYWNFFPAADGWGVLPMWGHATVEASNDASIAVGERVYGYLPMATHLDVEPGDVSRAMFVDRAAHRQPMSAIYNQYRRLAADFAADPAREGQRMVFQPLFTTSFLIEMMFRRANWYGADTLIVTSASSKTALALANVAQTMSPQVRRVGLTSAANLKFVRAGGQYDEVLSYDDLSQLAGRSAVLVDIAGNATVLSGVHTTVGNGLKYSAIVGATHVAARGGGRSTPRPGPEPVLFFAPDHAKAAIAAMGVSGFNEALNQCWEDFLAAAASFVTIDERRGLQAAADAYLDILRGAARPDVGIVVRP